MITFESVCVLAEGSPGAPDVRILEPVDLCLASAASR